MKKLSHNEMRKIWFSFWKSKNHEIIPSASLVPVNDPTLLWINAGVTPLKKYFDGTLIPNNDRMANCQKCIRTNDIENVGKTARHATFFEMLGNFSIGDYFKKDAITWSWEYLTSENWLNINPNKLYVTIYPTDEEAYETWRSLGVPEGHIIRLEGNFWEIGPGPSGPCSEIFYDRGEEYDKEGLGLRLLKEDLENDRYIEIWNNVFSMYNAEEHLERKDYKELPSKNIDTGMGLERMLVISQNVDTIFDTDLFIPIINKIEEITNQSYNQAMPFKVIAEHTRTVTFALADGANFGNSGRDYVLRRLLRRAIRYGKKLSMEEPFIYRVVPTIVDVMNEAYPYLKEHEMSIMEKIKNEEELFHKTLIEGEKRLSELIKNNLDKKISGADAFKLYDTYGFPLELTIEFAHENGFTVNENEFAESMRKQQEQARTSRLEVYSMNIQNEDLINFKTESTFVGYEKLIVSTKIVGLFDGKNIVNTLSNEGYIVLEETPFYAESGGQVSDSGILEIKGKTIEVIDLFKGPNNQHFHHVKFTGQLNVNDEVIAQVDETKRQKIMKNHSATHLLQKALRELFGDKIIQAGSRVDENTLRFDFVYDKRINDNEVIKIEEIVNSKIQKSTPTKIEIMSLDEAVAKGAIALFEEKYGDQVRVLTIADSVELCGGTHVENVKDIGRFAVKNIESKGNNIYRIEGATASNITDELFAAIKPYNDSMIKLLLKARKIVEQAHQEGIRLEFNFDINHDAPQTYKDVVFNRKELSQIKENVQLLEKNYVNAKIKKALSNLSVFEEKLEKINNIDTIIMSVNDYSLDVLKEIVNTLSNRYKHSLIFIANIVNNNVNYIARSTNSLKEKINCGEIIKDIAIKSNGSGGGSGTYAQGGGTLIDSVNQHLDSVKDIVKNINK